MDAVVAGNKEVAGASVVVEMVARAETAVAYEEEAVLFEAAEVVETVVAGIAVGDGVVAVAAVEEDGQVVAAGD